MADAVHLRERMLLTFEVAERQRTEAGTHNHLTFKRGAKLPFEGTRSPKSMVEAHHKNVLIRVCPQCKEKFSRNTDRLRRALSLIQ
ncbi:MAG: hypothetical protein CV081_06840 [Nitrospira sp. LK265]|nr:hypothetical protein [Nitrospira sp. LK265]